MAFRLRTSVPLFTAVLALALTSLTGCSGVNSDGNGLALPTVTPIADAPTPDAATAEAPPADPSAAGARTADAATRGAPVVAGRPARVFIFAGFDDNCQPLSISHITVTRAPAKGEISFKPGQETTIKTSEKGTCIGQTATGTGVYYTARAGMTGTDRFSVVAKLAGGEKAARSFEVQIVE